MTVQAIAAKGECVAMDDAKGIRSLVLLTAAIFSATAFGAVGGGCWTNVAGNVLAGEVVAVDGASVAIAAGGVTQRASRTAFPASENARMRTALGLGDEPPPVPSAIEPVWRGFAAKCAAKTVTREDLVTVKRFIAASALADDEKKKWTAEARQLAHAARTAAKAKR